MAVLPDYTLAKLLTEQALLQRNVVAGDRYGATDSADFQPYLTVACRLYWERVGGTRSANREYVNVSRQVAVSAGGMILPAGTDVTEMDQVTQVNRFDAPSGQWVLMTAGPFVITAVLSEFTHMELAVERTQLGG